MHDEGIPHGHRNATSSGPLFPTSRGTAALEGIQMARLSREEVIAMLLEDGAPKLAGENLNLCGGHVTEAS